jgi:ketosteroid isomerase-like protein
MMPLAWGIFLVGYQPTAQGPLPAADVAEIRHTYQLFMGAERDGDWTAAAELCTEDLVAMIANRPTLMGRAAWLEWAQSSNFSITDLSADALEIDGRADLAFVRGTYTVIYTAEGSPDPLTAAGKFLWILRKQNNAWRIAVSIGNSDGPPAGDR